MPAPAQADPLAVGDAGRHTHLQLAARLDKPAAATTLTAAGRHEPGATTGRTRLAADDPAERCADDLPQLPGPAATPTSDHAAARFSPRTAALLADVDGVVLDIDAAAARGEREVDLDFELDVVSGRATGGALPAEEGAERVAAEERFEDVAEGAERARRRLEPPLLEPRPAVAIVDRAALGVGENLVRLGQLLELLFRLRVVLVDVGVKLARAAPEGALDLALVGVARDAEQLVGVGFAHRS
ncbi:hypothetical protein HRbin41_00194 [bacterium HR41]|nr:hypothetical protein HRbin41_00194 [bacterium HR41]